MRGQFLLNQKQFESRLFGLSRASPCGLTTVTEPNMRQKNNPFKDRVAKISHVNGFLNWRYSSSVNRQRTRETRPADFTAMPRSWGQRVKGTPLAALVTADGWTLLYLEVKVERVTAEFRDSKTGELIPLADLRKYIIPPAKPVRQGLWKHITLRDYRLDHIAELRIDGETWRVRKCWNRLQKLTCGLFSGASL